MFTLLCFVSATKTASGGVSGLGKGKGRRGKGEEGGVKWGTLPTANRNAYELLHRYDQVWRMMRSWEMYECTQLDIPICYT